VDIVLGDHRKFEVDDVRQPFDVEAARRDLRGHQDGDPAGLEVVEGSDALALALVAVDRGSEDAVHAELFGQAVGAVLGSGEDERPIDSAGADEMAQQLALAFAIDRVDDLANQLDRCISTRDLDVGRVVQQAASKLPNLIGERGREQQVLAARR
jgi:hypothetical protein